MTNRELFIEEVWSAATFVRDVLNAPISAPVAVAQAILESGYGESRLATECRNLFGVKGAYEGNSCVFLTREFRNGEWVTVEAHFREYPHWMACFQDYADLISRLSWYQDAEDAAANPFDYLRGLLAKRDELGNVVEPGWATDPNYEKKILTIMERHKLISRDDETGLLQIYDDDRLLEFQILKQTLGETEEGGMKLQIRVAPTKWYQRWRYMLGLDKNPARDNVD